MATVSELTSGGYKVTVTGTEFALIRTALDEAERVTRFGIEVLDEADRNRDGEPSPDSPLLREIDALAMREASLRSLQKTLAEVLGDDARSDRRLPDAEVTDVAPTAPVMAWRDSELPLEGLGQRGAAAITGPPGDGFNAQFRSDEIAGRLA